MKVIVGLIVCAAGLLLAAVLFGLHRRGRPPADSKPLKGDRLRAEPWPDGWPGIPRSEDLPTGKPGNGDGKS